MKSQNRLTFIIFGKLLKWLKSRSLACWLCLLEIGSTIVVGRAKLVVAPHQVIVIVMWFWMDFEIGLWSNVLIIKWLQHLQYAVSITFSKVFVYVWSLNWFKLCFCLLIYSRFNGMAICIDNWYWLELRLNFDINCDLYLLSFSHLGA